MYNMNCEEEVLKIGKKLEKMISKDAVDHEQAQDMLKTLQNLPMTLEVLQKTRIGMTVNNFRKAASKDEAITLAKSLIKSWKKLLPGDSTSSINPPQRKTWKSLIHKNRNHNLPLLHQKMENPQNYNGNHPTPLPHLPNDPIRIKCRELLANALKPNTDDGFGAKSKYKNRVRSRVANLKDSKNPKLRENVLMGLIPPDRIASMTAEEMASNEMKELRAKYTKEAIDDHQMAKTGGTETDLVQTRSADEPMTTFVFCMNCGNRWKL
ncbi:hypothetical protein KUTeg_016171 [Tegillarca granosa]|uniref:Uncharacterized protein n=1 Tax=Tegillarca granosa TaxID=220873 RepID=A0ABQ9EML7_TEGGR|nr:hypothetical protein KUTeg_016171 [Tegillarca granosa]